MLKSKNKFLNLSNMDYQILWLKFLDLLDTYTPGIIKSIYNFDY